MVFRFYCISHSLVCYISYIRLYKAINMLYHDIQSLCLSFPCLFGVVQYPTFFYDQSMRPVWRAAGGRSALNEPRQA